LSKTSTDTPRKGPLKKQILDVIGAKKELQLSQKERVRALIETLFNQKPDGKSVTLQA